MDKHIITKEQAEQIVKEVFTVADFVEKWADNQEEKIIEYFISM